MKSVLIVGLGRFGQEFAKKLYEMGSDVMAIDESEERINESMPFLTNAQIGDATNEQFIASLGVNNFDFCVVAIGDDFESSLQTTALLKDSGARFVLARAKSAVHEKFLLRNGADSVVCTERDMAERLAMKYGADNIFDFIQLTDDYSIQNTARIMGIPCRGVGQAGIKKVEKWNYQCTGCHKWFKERQDECPVCGSPMRAHRKR